MFLKDHSRSAPPIAISQLIATERESLDVELVTIVIHRPAPLRRPVLSDAGCAVHQVPARGVEKSCFSRDSGQLQETTHGDHVLCGCEVNTRQHGK